MWMLASPDGKLKVTVAQKENGGLYYAVSRDGKEVLAESGLGICTDLGDFTTGLAFEKEERNSVREKYSLPAGKKEVYTNEAEELALYFGANDSEFIIRLRAFDDGMAFRYEIRHPDRETLLVKREETEFQISTDCQMWLQDWVPTYEGPYNARNWDKSINGQPFGMPSLFYHEQDGIWLMINEANVINTNGSYCLAIWWGKNMAV